MAQAKEAKDYYKINSNIVVSVFNVPELWLENIIIMKNIRVKVKRIGSNKAKIIVKYKNGNTFSFVTCKKIKIVKKFYNEKEYNVISNLTKIL